MRIQNITDIKNIFYINLDTRTDRKTFFENQMRTLGLRAERFTAIRHSIGAIGCTLSHIALLKYAKTQNLDHILIMEDDIMFMDPQAFINNLNNCLFNHSDFDVLLIAGNNMGKYLKLSNNCVRISKCQTTTGYLVKSHYYDKLIQNYEAGMSKLIKNINLHIVYAIDKHWSILQTIDKWYLVTPLSVSQKPDYSDIEQKHVNYNHVMLELDKKDGIHMNFIKAPHITPMKKRIRSTLPHPMKSVIHKNKI